ncbi:MAG: hypothetical protein DWQ05_03475 [Calditrichaeota bacterium]|nr:MAG: hypothetical protein DWQ05_03475 [Calditrichota bacterium]
MLLEDFPQNTPSKILNCMESNSVKMKIKTGLKSIAWIAIFTSTAFANPAPRFTAFSATATTLVAGKTANYTITFNPQENVAINGTFTVNFPAKFDLSSVTSGAIISGLDGGLIVSNNPGNDSSNYVILTRNGTGTVFTAGGQIQLRFDGVVNSDSTGDFNLDIRHSGSGELPRSTQVTISADVIDHFNVTNTSDGNIATQTAGTNFSTKITAKDQYDNTATTWTGSITLSDNTTTLTPTSTSISSNGTVTVSNTNITQTGSAVNITATSGAITGTSNDFVVDPAAIDHFTVTNNSDGNIIDQTAGTAFTIKLTAYDQYNNIKTDYAGSPALSVNVGDISPASASGFSSGTVSVTNTTINTANTGITISATDGAASGTSNSFNVDSDVIHHFAVTNTADGNIATQTAGVDFSTKITAQDQFDNTVTSWAGTVTLSDSTTTLTPISATGFVNGSVTVTNTNITQTDAANAVTATSGAITGTSNNFIVDPAAIDHFTVTDDPSGIIGGQAAGVAFTIKITAYDQYNNIKTDYAGSPALSVNIGDLSPASASGFAAGTVSVTNTTINTANTGVTITATDGAASGTSNSFNVNPDAIDHFTVTNTSDGTIATQTAGVDFSIKITAKDQFDNTVTTWGGTVNLTDNTTTLTPITAVLASGTVTVTNTNITQSGAAVNITATSGSVSGISNNFVVDPDVINQFSVTNTSGDAIATQTAGVDFSTKITAQDQFGNTVTSWAGTVTLSDSTTTLTPTSATGFVNGSVTVTNTNITQTDAANAITATSGGITGTSNDFIVDPAALDHFSVTDDPSGDIGNQVATVAFTIKITAFDQFNNVKTDYAGSPVLSVNMGDLSPASASGFVSGVVSVTNTTINTANTGVTITATDGAALGTSNSFDILVGAVVSIKILEGESGNNSVLSGVPITTDTLITAHAAGFDAGDNYVQDELAAWSLSDTSLGRISVTNGVSTTFDPRKPGTNELQADHSGTSTSAGSGNYIVAVGVVQNIKILTGASGETAELGDQSVASGATLTVHAGGYDSKFNYAQDETVSWSVTGGIGTIGAGPSVSAIFTGTTIGTGLIKADHSSVEVIDAYSGTITVSLGSIDYVLLRTAINGGGEAFSTHTMTADESVTIYAAGYDAQNNYIGNESVTWSAASGSFSPSSGSTTVFSPSLTGNVTVTGTPVAGTPSSAIVTVNPGVPAGSVTLTPASSVLPADGVAETTVTSSIIKDSEGNNVGAAKEFTISLSKANLGTILNDINPTIAGVQIATDASSKLVFTFRAGTLGGTTNLFASSTNGSANGSTELTLTSMSIVSVSTASSTVSRGQQDAQLTLTVENNGSQDITITSANPVFTHASDGITEWTGFENITRMNPEVTSIPGNGGSVALTYNVDITVGAAIDSVIVDGIINGTVSGTAVSDSAAENRAPRWNIQKNPSVGIVSVTPVDAVVDQGTAGHIVSVVINVPGGDAETANAVIDNIKLIFKNGNTDVSTGYIVSPVTGNPTIIPGTGGNVQLDYKVDVLSQAQIGTITLDAELTAHDANSGLQATDLDGASATGTWTVESSESVTIVSVIPSQAKVTANMSKQWTIQVVVDNSSSSTVNVTSLDLRFFAGAVEKTNEFTITPPALTAIGPHSQGNYNFAIDTTGSTTGLISIDAHFIGSDGSLIDLTDANSSFTVQTAASVSIKEIIVPATVTANQTTPWNVKTVLQNLGEADAEINFSTDSTHYLFSDETGYSITSPVQLSSGNTFLTNSGIDTLSFIVNTTGASVGSLNIGAVIRGYDKNSSVTFKDSTTAVELQQVVVQTPAALTIDSTYISSLNAPSVNRLQEFQIRVKIRNTGQESLDSVVVSLASDEITSPSSFLPLSSAYSIPGESTTEIPISITAADRSGSETFTASIYAAKGLNSGVKITPGAAIDSSEQAILQTPAAIQIVQVVPSAASVFANQLSDWTITATIKNNGEATARLKPQAADLGFVVNSQNDTQNYTVSSPGTVDLTGNGQESDIVYTINRTGIQSGDAAISVNLGATDVNTGAAISAAGNTNKLIEENSSVLIIKAEIIAPNVVNNDGIVNTDQSFSIRVSVKNNGVDAVQEASVRLKNQFVGGAFSELTGEIATIQPNEIKTIDFPITAGPSQNDIGETVTAILDTATVTSSGNGANIGEPVKNEVRFFTQVPAELQVTASTNFIHQQLQKDQEFRVTATVTNRGLAGLSGMGQLRIDFPAGYSFSTDSVQTKEVTFDMNAPSLTWRLISPDANSSIPGGDPVSVRFLGTPLDINSGNPAQQFNNSDTLLYSVGDLAFEIDSLRIVSPQGAAENNKISSGSTFTLRLFLRGWRRLLNPSATLVLPAGFAYSGSETGNLPVLPVVNDDEQGYVEWNIIAPASATETETKSLNVTLQGTDGNGGLHTKQTSLNVDLVPKALLNLVLDGGETSLSLAMGQAYDLRVILQNSGSAGVSNTATIVIDTSNSQITFTGTPAQTDTLTGVEVDDINIWRLQMPNKALQTSIKVNLIDPRPSDIYTGQPAALVPGGNELHVNIAVRETGSILISDFAIFEPIGATDNIISTDQQFRIKAKLIGLDVKDVDLQLKQMAGTDFSIENASRQPASIDNFNSVGETFEWKVTAPANASVDSFAIVWSYKDATSGDDVLPGESGKVVVTTVKKPSYSFTAEIVSPASATDKIVSPNQKFTIQADLIKLGTANLQNGTTINVRLKDPPPGYVTDSLNKEQSVGTLGGTASWVITAPESKTETETIEIELFSLPLDENSGLTVNFTQTNISIPIRTNSGQLEMREMDVVANSVVAEGQDAVELLRLGFTNKGDEYASLIDLLSLKVDVFDAAGESLIANEVLESLSARQILEDTENVILNTAINPVDFDENWMETVFLDTLKLVPDSLYVISLYGKIKGGTKDKKFSLRISEKSYINAQDHGSRALVGLELVDKNGNARDNLQISSKAMVIVGSDFSTNFFNYPNPFNPNTGTTRFSYTLLEPSTVTFDVYTLFGELVYHREFAETEPEGLGGGEARTITWNGRNGANQVVLSGIYVAYIKAGSNIAKTTVAVIR